MDDRASTPVVRCNALENLQNFIERHSRFLSCNRISAMQAEYGAGFETFAPDVPLNGDFVEDTQGREAPIQRLADSIAGPFVYTVMTLLAATFSFWYYVGVHVFPNVLLNDISGSMENPLLLSLKLSTDVLMSHIVIASGNWAT